MSPQTSLFIFFIFTFCAHLPPLTSCNSLAKQEVVPQLEASKVLVAEQEGELSSPSELQKTVSAEREERSEELAQQYLHHLDCRTTSFWAGAGYTLFLLFAAVLCWWTFTVCRENLQESSDHYERI